MTIKEIELASVSTDVKNNISKNRLAIGDVAFDDIIPYNFQIREDDVFRDNPTLKAIIFEGTNSSEENFQAPYWVDGKIIDVNFAKDQVKFRVNFLQHAGLGSRHFWNNLEGDQEDLKTIYYIVRPIVKLNTNLHMEKDTTTGEWNIIG